MDSVKARAVNGTIRTIRHFCYNTPVMQWKLTGMVYDKVFSLGAPDLTKPISFRGANFYVDPKDRSYLPTMAAGYYEKLELNIFEKIAQISHTFLDVGSNIGMYSVLASLMNPRIKCFAFEPVKENYDILAQNVELNGFSGSIDIVKKAVSDKNGKATIYLSSTSSGMHSLTVQHEGESRKIDTITIDSFCNKRGVQPDLIKVDVEGHEPSAFAGMTETLKSSDATIFMEFLAGVNNEMDALIKAFGKKYKYCYVVDEIKGTLQKSLLTELTLQKNYNIILVRRPAHKKAIESFLI